MRIALAGAFVLGLVLMVGFESVVTRVLGMACLFAFIIGGVFLIADPDVLGSQEEGMPDDRTR